MRKSSVFATSICIENAKKNNKQQTNKIRTPVETTFTLTSPAFGGSTSIVTISNGLLAANATAARH